MITSMMQEIMDIAEISPVLNPPLLDFGVIMNSETKNNNKKQMHLSFKLISRKFNLKVSESIKLNTLTSFLLLGVETG